MKEVYPQDFSDDQKVEYDLFVRQAKVLFPEAEDWTIKLGCEAYVRLGNRERPELNENEVEELKSKHRNEPLVYETIITEQLKYIEPPVEFISSSTLDNAENI